MEYFLGSLITLAIVFIMARGLQTEVKKNNFNIVFTQSHRHDMLFDQVPFSFAKRKQPKKQSFVHLQRHMVRVICMDNMAYWIKDSALYVADIVGGKIEENSARKLDIYTVDDIQLKKIQFIVEKLTEGLANDSGNSGNK